MQHLLKRIRSKLYAQESFVHKWRRERMQETFERLRLPPHVRIADLGGSECVWKLLDHDYHVTLVNLPGSNRTTSDPDRFTIVDGDACSLRDLFGDMSFDAVHSNSTIEHVGDESRQALFAAEVHRLAPAYWVHTPSSHFPIEIHTGVPFYWTSGAGARGPLAAVAQQIAGVHCGDEEHPGPFPKTDENPLSRWTSLHRTKVRFREIVFVLPLSRWRVMGHSSVRLAQMIANREPTELAWDPGMA